MEKIIKVSTKTDFKINFIGLPLLKIINPNPMKSKAEKQTIFLLNGRPFVYTFYFNIISHCNKKITYILSSSNGKMYVLKKNK